MATEVTETKGNNILNALRALELRLGKERIERILGMMPNDLGQRMRLGGISSGSWYPVTWYAALLDTTTHVCPDVPDLMRATGFSLVQHDLSGIYRVLVRLLSPQMLISWGPRTFSQYYRGGIVNVTAAREGYAEAKYSHWHGFNAAIWRTVVGGSEAAIVACGAQQAKVQIIKGGTLEEAHFLIHWKT